MCVQQPRTFVDTNVRLHSEIPLLAFPRCICGSRTEALLFADGAAAKLEKDSSVTEQLKAAITK